MSVQQYSPRLDPTPMPYNDGKQPSVAMLRFFMLPSIISFLSPTSIESRMLHQYAKRARISGIRQEDVLGRTFLDGKLHSFGGQPSSIRHIVGNTRLLHWYWHQKGKTTAVRIVDVVQIDWSQKSQRWHTLLLKKYPEFLKHIETQTKNMCLLAIREYALMIRYVKKQRADLVFTALSKDPFTLKFIRNQTPKMCAIAVYRNPLCYIHITDSSTRERMRVYVEQQMMIVHQ